MYRFKKRLYLKKKEHKETYLGNVNCGVILVMIGSGTYWNVSTGELAGGEPSKNTKRSSIFTVSVDLRSRLLNLDVLHLILVFSTLEE